MPHENDGVQVRPRDGLEGFRRLVDDFFGRAMAPGGRGGETWVPPTDVYETQQEIVILMCVPGIKTGNVRVLLDGEVLTIAGHRQAVREPGLVAYHQMEIRNGYFERRIIIHVPVDPEAATAQYRDGFLWIRLPKVGAAVHRIYSLRLRL